MKNPERDALPFFELSTLLKKILLISGLLLGLFIRAKAQPYYFRSYGESNGVSSNTITCITQDQKGFMWFGTRNGLNRFDGYTFRTFRNSVSDPQSLGSNSILSLFEAPDEKLWIGTYKGISIYNPVTEKFSSFAPLAQSEIRAVRGDKNGNIWMVADNRLYRYQKESNRLTYFPFTGTTVTNVAVSATGAVWVGTSTSQLKRFNPSDNSFTDFSIAGSLKNPDNAIQDIFPASDSAIIVGTMYNALSLNPVTGRTTNLSTLCSLNKDIQVHQVAQQSPTEFWFGTETGLYVMDLATKKATQIQKERDNPYSLTDNVVYTLYKDKEGSTWLGTFFGGINYYSRQNNMFRKYFPHRGLNDLSGNLVHEICRDQYGKLWVGTEDAGLNRLDLSTGTVKQFMPNGKGSIAYRNIHGLLADGDELWIGTYEHGLDVMDLKTEKVIRHYNAKTGPGSLSSDFIVTLYKTPGGEILVGTWSGLFRYDRKNDNFIADPFFTMQIQSIHEDREGTLWIASYGKGVYFYNRKNGQRGNLRYDPARANSLPNDYVNSVYEDSYGDVWFCTEGGLAKYVKQTKNFARYSTANGLPDNQVFRMLEDNHHRFWVSTAKGLASFDRSLQHVNVYTTAHGLLSNQFNYNSSYKTKDGTLFFGTVKGMISFDPGSFTKEAFIPPVYITGIQVNNQPVPVGGESPVLKESITYAHAIKLPYNRSTISFDVAALSYNTPELNTYVYKMEGYDKEWTTITSPRRIYYTKLPPGHYLFKVKGSNGGEVWNSHEASLRIHISPPIWGSFWAYLFYGLVVAGTIYTITRYYHLAQTEKNKRRFEAFEREKEREVYESKIDFFTNVAHEIRTPLTLIKLPFETLVSKLSDPDMSESLDMMNKNINRLVDLTNQLLDFRKAEAKNLSLNFTKADINDAMTEVYEAFKPLAAQKELDYRLQLPRIALQAFVDHEAFQKILSNLFSNAVKYAGSKVLIRLLPFSSDDNFFTIEVKNDGHLVAPELKEKIFEPFYRIRETERQQGTGIGLALSRSLTELHKGTLELLHPADGLNTFRLSLPIHQEKEISFVRTKEIQPGDEVKQEPVSEHESAPERPTVLLVEDNREILDFVGKELKAKYNIRKCQNGQEALDLLRDENVHLVISDIMMPVMNGIDLCKKVKTDLQFSHIPFILLTAKNTLNSRIEGLEVGADAYIEKPFSIEHLQAQVSNLLTNRQIVKDYFARSPLTHLKGIACSNADKTFLEDLHQAISDHITDMELDVDQLSRLMNMSRPTLYRKIKALSNLSPNELINLSRLKKAAELLSQGNYRIVEVANLVGYTVAGNFTRDFQKQFGMTPSAYVQKLQEEKI